MDIIVCMYMDYAHTYYHLYIFDIYIYVCVSVFEMNDKIWTDT